MKRKTVILFCAATVLSCGLFASVNTYASTTAEEEAKNAVTQYLQSVQVGDVEGMMEYTKDLRFPDEAQKRDSYELLALDTDAVRDLEVLSLNTIDSANMLLRIKFTSKYSGPHELELPVIKENGHWKVVVGGEQRSEK